MKEGVGPLWNGTAASLILVSNPALKFTVYEYLKRLASEPLSPSKAFFMGAFASAIATIITYPVQVVQAKSRVSYLSLIVTFWLNDDRSLTISELNVLYLFGISLHFSSSLS